MTTATLSRPLPALRYSPRINQPPLPMQLPIYLLRPPYVRASGPTVLASQPSALELPGTILAIRLDRPCADPHEVERLAAELSRRAPACPVVVLLRMPSDDALAAAVRLAPLRIRAVLPEVEPLQPLLAPLLTDPAGMPRAVVAWLQDHQVRLNPNTAALIEGILAKAPEHPSLGSLLEQLHVPLSSARFRMRKKALPSPSRWFQAARALRAALILQASPDTSTRVVAHRLGFADHSALAHLLRRTFQATSRDIRETLGWEWLLHRWLRRWRSDPPTRG